MSRRLTTILTSLLLSTSFVCSASYTTPRSALQGHSEVTSTNDSIENVAPVDNVKFRENITFILGEDHDADNLYYTEAFNYYSYNVEAHTEYIDTSCRSLLEVRNRLENLPPSNGMPWGNVNVVVHSNEWSDMGVAVVPDGERAAVESIEFAIQNGQFTANSNTILDAHTTMNIMGCGLGRNTELLATISKAFGGDDADMQRPVVRSSRFFIFYESDRYKGQPINCERYMAEFWYAHHPSFHKPAEGKMAKQLNENYPDANIDWDDAMTRTTPRFAGDAYHYSFRIPIVWWVTYEDAADRPEVHRKSPKADRLAYVKEQEELLEAIEAYGFDVNDFRWTVRPATYENEDGSKEPAMKVIGQCTIICILNPLTEEENGKVVPVTPSFADTDFFGIAGPGYE